MVVRYSAINFRGKHILGSCRWHSGFEGLGLPLRFSLKFHPLQISITVRPAGLRSTMCSSALFGRLLLLLCFAELAKTADTAPLARVNSELGEAAAEEMKGTYRFGEMATTKCQAGDVKITDDKECKAATSALLPDGQYKGTASRSDKPGGCWAGTSGHGNFNSNMAGQAAQGRRPLCKKACKTNTQPALPACPAKFYTSDTTTSCTECVNNQAQIRECGCEDTSSSCDGVRLHTLLSRKSCTRPGVHAFLF